MIFILECADGTFFSAMSSNFRGKMWTINNGLSIYFKDRSKRLPAKLVYEEKSLLFKEAYAKFRYMKKMSRKQKIRLINEGIWPIGGTWKKYIDKKLSEL